MTRSKNQTRTRRRTAVDKESESFRDFTYWLVVVYFILDYVRPQSIFPAVASLRPGLILQLICFVTLLTRLPVRVPRQLKMIFLFVVLMAINVPLANNNYEAYMKTREITIAFFCIWLPMTVFFDKEKKLFSFMNGWWIAIHLFLAVYSIQHKGRGMGAFLGDENDICTALLVGLPFVYFAIFSNRHPVRRILLILVLMVIIVSIMDTQSRGGFVGLVVTALFCWLYTPRKIVATTVVLAVLLAMIMFAPPGYWDEVKSIRTAHEANDTGGKRIFYWSLGMRMFKDRPLIGWGAGNFEFTAYTYQTIEESSGMGRRSLYGKSAHSMYFQIIPEMGIVGVTLFLALLITSLRALFRVLRGCKRALRTDISRGTRVPEPPDPRMIVFQYLALATIGGFIACLSSGMFISILYYPHFWILNVFTAILTRQYQSALEANRAFAPQAAGGTAAETKGRPGNPPPRRRQ